MPICFDPVAARHSPQDEWKERCRQFEVPYLAITTRGKFCSVEWSIETLAAAQREVAKQRHQDLLGEMLDHSISFYNPRTTSIVSSNGGCFYDIELAKADALAGMIFELLLTFVASSRPQMH
jgi:hypothetical protein